MTDKAAELEPPKKSAKEAEEEVVITTEDLDLMENVLEKVAKEKKIDVDKETLEDLKEDVMEYKEVRREGRAGRRTYFPPALKLSLCAT